MTAVFGERFSYVETPYVREALHHFDRRNVSKLFADALGNDDAITEYRVRQLVEEAISSSMLEGARPTTREVARQMVREGREPTSRDERMILNNWRAMRRIVELIDNKAELDLNLLLDLHQIIGSGTLDVPDAEGRLRTNEHDVRVRDMEGVDWHVPPQATDPDGNMAPLPERVESLLAFANGRSDGATFIHPALRAIISHYWMAYEHPFRDGNGRMARALYYWVMLKNGYEIAEFLSISGPIDKQARKYYRSFALVHTDNHDVTYFILHQLEVLNLAMEELTDHLKARVERTRRLAQLISSFDTLNHRQRALLQRAVRKPLQTYTIEGHATSHHVTYHTARSDLARLVALGFLSSKRVGKGKRFAPTRKITSLQERREGAS